MKCGKQWMVSSAALLLVLSLGGAVDAQTVKQTTARPVGSIEGVDTFKAYCGSCHGAQAKGDGPVASALKKAPANLTGIAKRHGGKFSPTDVEAVIMGRQTSISQTGIPSHGTRDMPIWGDVFKAVEKDPNVVELRVHNLVAYLESIQAK